MVDGILVALEGLALELGVVHLAEHVDQVLEEGPALLEVFEVIVLFADAQHEVQHVALALDRAQGVDRVEGVLLEDEFEDFEKCRTFFKDLINVLRQMNYSEFQSETFASYRETVDKMIA